MALPLDILNMHRIIEQDVQRLAFFAYKEFESEEVDLQINREIFLLVDGILDKYFGRTLKTGPEQGFQQNQITLDNLQSLQVGYAPVTLVTDGNTSQFALPSNYYHHIKTRVQISYPCWENGKEVNHLEHVDVRVIRSQMDFRNNPFHKSGKDSPVAEIFGNTFYIFTDGTFKIDYATCTYIRKPATVLFAKDINGDYDAVNSVHCDLDASLHYLLVDMVSQRIMKILETNPQKIAHLQQEIT